MRSIQMLPDDFREVLSLAQSLPFAVKNHAAQLIAKAFGRLGIRLIAEALGQAETLFLIVLFPFKAQQVKSDPYGESHSKRLEEPTLMCCDAR